MSVRSIEAEVSIKSGVQAECTIGREVIVEVHDGDMTLDSLTVTANGTYQPTGDVDGYDRVTVNVPERVPVTESLTATENGLYEPSEGIDGYDRVTVAVPPTVPDIEPLTVTANGVYTASGDGYNPVTVNVPAPEPSGIKRIEITENGTKIEDVAGYANAEIIANVITALGMTLDWADVREVTIGPNSVSNSIDAQTYLSSFTYTFLILKDALTVNNQLVFAGSNNLGTSLNTAYRCRNNTIGSTGISASYDCKLVEGSVYYAITKKTS